LLPVDPLPHEDGTPEGVVVAIKGFPGLVATAGMAPIFNFRAKLRLLLIPNPQLSHLPKPTDVTCA
jgi:hypothetical protein